ncbi:hypothetical protein [Halomonas sp. S2151]|uniref:hypothetical protein n=1 Tax=Halomonas sp. S2151 TaxID=579478 RepID=UPI0012ECCDD6|nr:hypothetical protein [Halomonas sp. S2151]
MLKEKAMVMLGGNPGNGVYYVAQTYRRKFGWDICTKFRQVYKKGKKYELVFFENSNKNFIALVLLRIIGCEVSYFMHGDHFMPDAKKQYGSWAFFKEVFIVIFAMKIYSHSNISFSILKEHFPLSFPEGKAKKINFPISEYLSLRWRETTTDIKGNGLFESCYIESSRINKTSCRWLSLYKKKAKVKNVYPISAVDYDNKLCQARRLFIPSESESLCLAALDAAHLGVKEIYVHKLIGVSEYKDELVKSYPEVQFYVVSET